MLVAAADDVFLEAAKNCREASAAAESYDAESTGECLRFVCFSLHRMTQRY
jgi:hypothetical protein